jgi:hypothetical protein
VKKYEIRLKHDNGEITIRTSATDIGTAIQNVCKAENCPKSAVQSWRIVPTKKQIKKTQSLLRSI